MMAGLLQLMVLPFYPSLHAQGYITGCRVLCAMHLFSLAPGAPNTYTMLHVLPSVQSHQLFGHAAGAAGQPVVSCYIHHDKRFAFVEFRTVEEASNSIALDGVGYRNEILRVSTLFCPLSHLGKQTAAVQAQD